MQNDAFLSVGERNLKCPIDKMMWSPKRDLIALATCNGDLLLHRLSSVEKVWSLPPLNKGSRIHSICWRPDGSVIAVSYNTKESGIRLVYMEKSQIIWHLSEEKSLLKSSILSLKWFEQETEKDDAYVSSFSSLSFKDYIAELPKLKSKDLQNIDVKSVIESSKFNILLLCDEHNTIFLYAYGIFPLLTIPLSNFEMSSDTFHVMDVHLSSDFKLVSVGVASNSDKTTCDVLLYDISEVMERLDICKTIAEKSCYLTSTLVYVENVLDLMKESCETVVQEMESKLTNFLSNQNISSGTTIGDEFMHFLMWGKPSVVLEDLLVNQVTQKSIIKLGTVVEASYTSIQQLLLVNFQLAADAIYYHLNEIKGMSTTTILGNLQIFDRDHVDDVIKCTGSLFLKANELQQVIGQSLKNFKAFFRWLYLSLLKMNEEPADQITQMTVKELEFVADFVLESFIREHEDASSTEKDHHFNLDKVYQYLENSPLVSPQNLQANDWFRLVDSTPSLSGNPHILKRRADASLRQLVEELKRKLKFLLNCSYKTVSRKHLLQKSHITTSQSVFSPQCCQWYRKSENDDDAFFFIITTSTLPCDEVLLIKSPTNAGVTMKLRINFSQFDSSDRSSVCQIHDVTYYNEQFLCFIIRTNQTSFLVQVGISSLVQELEENNNATLHVCDASRFVTHRCTVTSMNPVKLASSGTRKVTCLLDADLRHIRAYEMDQPNDEDDDDELDNSTT